MMTEDQDPVGVPMSPGARDAPASTEFLYRSMYTHEVDLVADQLEQAGIALFRSVERMGVRLAMPLASGVACLPGSWFLVVVPARHAARARALVSALPVSQNE